MSSELGATLPHRSVHDSSDSRIHVSIVVPVYRSHASLRELHRRIKLSVEQIPGAHEIIFVEDCGGDASWSTIEALAKEDSCVVGLQLSRNFGQHAATICGFSRSRGKFVVTLDDDLEQPPERIPDLVCRAEEGFDLVYGVFPERTHRGWRNLTSSLARRILSAAVPSLNYDYTSFRAIRGKVARALVQFDSPFPFVDGYLSWLTNRYATVQVAHGERFSGTSNYTLSKLIVHTINIFVTFSDQPLRLASWIGLVFSAVGMAWGGIIVIGRLSGFITVSGFASIMAAIILFGGIQLLILGIFGEYLGRMNFKSSRKPLFLVGRETADPNSYD